MDAGWSAAAAVAVRVLLGAAVLAPVAVVQLRGRWYLVRRYLPLMAVYGAMPVAGCQLAYFTAVEHVPVGVALLIEYTAPVAVVGWLWLRQGQRPTRLTVAGTVLGAAGLLLVIDLTGGTTSMVGVLWALVAMVGAAFYFVLSSRDVEGLPGTVLAAGGLLVGGLLLLLAGVVGAGPAGRDRGAGRLRRVHRRLVDPGAPARRGDRGGRPTAAGSPATRRLGARLASFVVLSEVLAALIFAGLLLGQVPAPVQLLGGVLIVAGVVTVRRGEPAA